MNIKVNNLIQNSPTYNKAITIKIDIENSTVGDLKKLIYTELNLENIINYNNIGLSYSLYNQNKKSLLSIYHPLLYYENFNNPSCEVFVKDIGRQISYKTVYFLEYLGPEIIILLFYIHLYYEKKSDNKKIPWIQEFFFFMSNFHFIKRIIETFFVHIFSRDTMPLFNLFKNCIYYWGIYGLFCGYFLFHKDYNIKFLLWFRYIFVIFFISSEVYNFRCHMILRELKLKNNYKKQIPPEKDGFEYVTCANYFWEFLSWLNFSFFCLHWSVFIFTILGFIQMRSWALKKHKEMCLLFGDLYPAQRKAFIPFFI